MNFKQLVFVCFLLFGLSSCEQKSKVIRLGHGLSVDHSVHKAMVYMGEELLKISDGKMKMEIYPSQQLGTERQCLELLQIGSLDMTKVSAAVMENFSPKMKILSLPYLFRDREHAFKVLDSEIGQELLDGGTKYLLKGLAYYDSGSRSFYTKTKPVLKPSDLSGLKIRVMESVSAMEMVSQLGGSPTPISWGELYTALQQGVVDGAENNPPSFFLSRHYEVCKYYSLDEHTTIPDVLIAGTSFWNKLSEQEKEWLKMACIRSVKVQRDLWRVSEMEALEAVRKAGVEIIEPDKTPFTEKVKEMKEAYKSDQETYSLIERIQTK